MAVPRSVDARLYYRCAYQRYEDAEILHGMAWQTTAHTTGTVYLAGYGIECMLKALILSVAKASQRQATIQSFRKFGQGHDFEWLRAQYYQNGGARFPRDVNQRFGLVLDWSTELRYEPRPVKPAEAESFMAATAVILKWADGRL